MGCLAGIQPDPSPSPPQGQQATSPPRRSKKRLLSVEAVVKSPLRTTKPSTRTRVSSSSKRGELKVLRENCNSQTREQEPLKTRPHPPHPSSAWCAATCWSCEKKTLAFSEDDPVFPEVETVKTTSVKDQHTPSQAFPPGLGAPSVFPGLTGTASLCNISHSSLLTSFVKGN